MINNDVKIEIDGKGARVYCCEQDNMTTLKEPQDGFRPQQSVGHRPHLTLTIHPTNTIDRDVPNTNDKKDLSVMGLVIRLNGHYQNFLAVVFVSSSLLALIPITSPDSLSLTTSSLLHHIPSPSSRLTTSMV